MGFQGTAPGLDELLLDTATIIELSDHDREVANSRYRRLQIHLERPSSPLRQYLLGSASLIYAHGSMAIGATIVSGTEDDRFDVDALVEMKVPASWSSDEPLDQLYEALQGFPGVEKIIRCTRCVQLQFAFMHMDVTIIDPAAEPRIPRVGEIFHSPNARDSHRVLANPYGFADWYRTSVAYPSEGLVSEVTKRRQSFGINRLIMSPVEKAEQKPLPPAIPPRIDAQQVIALKLMKRYINIRYEKRPIKKPPSVYLTKLSQMCGFDQAGLTAQLERFAAKIESEMELAYSVANGPDERNPRLEAERLNDRWPQTQEDRKTLADDMSRLLNLLRVARSAEIKDLPQVLTDLFGEKISKRSVDAFIKRMDQSVERKSLSFERGSGAIVAAPSVISTSSSKAVSSIPRHNFHCELRKKK